MAKTTINEATAKKIKAQIIIIETYETTCKWQQLKKLKKDKVKLQLGSHDFLQRSHRKICKRCMNQ